MITIKLEYNPYLGRFGGTISLIPIVAFAAESILLWLQFNYLHVELITKSQGFHYGCGDDSVHLALVVQRLDNAIHRINHYPVDSVVYFVNTYPLDSDLSGG